MSIISTINTGDRKRERNNGEQQIGININNPNIRKKVNNKFNMSPARKVKEIENLLEVSFHNFEGNISNDSIENFQNIVNELKFDKKLPKGNTQYRKHNADFKLQNLLLKFKVEYKMVKVGQSTYMNYFDKQYQSELLNENNNIIMKFSNNDNPEGKENEGDYEFNWNNIKVIQDNYTKYKGEICFFIADLIQAIFQKIKLNYKRYKYACQRGGGSEFSSQQPVKLALEYQHPSKNTNGYIQYTKNQFNHIFNEQCYREEIFKDVISSDKLINCYMQIEESELLDNDNNEYYTDKISFKYRIQINRGPDNSSQLNNCQIMYKNNYKEVNFETEKQQFTSNEENKIIDTILKVMQYGWLNQIDELPINQSELLYNIKRLNLKWNGDGDPTTEMVNNVNISL